MLFTSEHSRTEGSFTARTRLAMLVTAELTCGAASFLLGKVPHD